MYNTMHRSMDTRFRMFQLWFWFVGILVAGIFALNFIGAYRTADLKGVHVLGKENVVQSDSDGRVSSRYLVFTDNETFEVTATIMNKRFDIARDYGRIEKGQVCDMHVAGWSFPALGIYRNLISYECAAPQS